MYTPAYAHSDADMLAQTDVVFPRWFSSKRNDVKNVLQAAAVTARTQTRSATHTESWCKGLISKVANMVGLPMRDVRKEFRSTRTRNESFKSVPWLFKYLLEIVSSADVRVRVVVFNAVNAYVHSLIRQRYSIESFIVATAFAFASSYVTNMHSTWMLIQGMAPGTVGLMAFYAGRMQLQTDDWTVKLLANKVAALELADATHAHVVTVASVYMCMCMFVCAQGEWGIVYNLAHIWVCAPLPSANKEMQGMGGGLSASHPFAKELERIYQLLVVEEHFQVRARVCTCLRAVCAKGLIMVRRALSICSASCASSCTNTSVARPAT